MKQWVLREQISPDLVRQILFYRDIKTDEEIEKFLNPDYKRDLHDPFGILNMDKAVERILQAIKNNEKIVIFGDYDADGVCAGAIFTHFFKKIDFSNFHIHIPDRHLEGYGLNEDTLDEFIEQKTNLIITLDCGITDVKEVDKFNSHGIDVIIVDHHLVPEVPPNAFAIINSKQKDDIYPFKHLCGAGITFKVIQALIKKGRESGSAGWRIIPGWEKWLLDLVALATVADMVPLVDENRILTFYGLKVLAKTQRVGLLSFFRRMEISPKNITEDDIAFMIAPRINIASRMDHANMSYALLTTESSGEADWINTHLETLNSERRIQVEKILDEIGARINSSVKDDGKTPAIIVEGDFSWNPGVLGLMANRLMEKYNCPVVLWGKGEAKQIKGSARAPSARGINLVELLKMVPEEILSDSGGHALSAGFSLTDGKMEDFEKEVLVAYEKIAKGGSKEEIVYIDRELDINEINWENYGIIEKLGPFGIGNPKPVFLFSDLEIAGVRKFGNGGPHLQLDFKKPDNGKVSAIGFFFKENGTNLKVGQKIDLVASMEKSTYFANPELRLRIIDIKIKE